MLRHKGQLAIAACGLIVMSVTFGAGLGLMFPIFNYLLKEGMTLGDIVREACKGGMFEEIGNTFADRLPTDPFNGFMLVMVAILVTTIVGGIGRFLHTYMIAISISRVIEFWRITLFRKMVRMDMACYWAHGMADGASRIMTDVEHLRNGYQGILVRSSQAILKVIMSLVVAFMINWQLTAMALIGGPVIALVVRKFGKSVRKAMRGTLEAQAQMLTRMNESLADLRVIKMSQSEGTESRKFFRSAQRGCREQIRQYRARAVSSFIVEIIAVIGVIIVAGISAWAIFKQHVPATQFMMVLAALVAAGASFKPLSNLHHDLIAADAAGARIIELNKRITSDIAESSDALPHLPRHTRSLRFEKLTYTYPGAKSPALKGINLEIPFGQMIAIVGGNGSGKSTLVSALARLIVPDSGRILIDDKDIFTHNLRSVRSQMAMVTQKTKLFMGSIGENIAYGRSWTHQQDIEKAAHAATADLFIDTLPDRYNTMLGEGGEGVSGGQAQRLCIARAVLRNPAILILDEATSQVDTTSEALIAAAMEQITHGRTTLVIAHRMSTIVHADRIIVMEHGLIVGQGKHDELLQSCPQYVALAKGQFAAATTA